MKSYSNLWPRITAFENLYLAFREARRGKRARAEVAAFEYDLERNLLALQDELVAGWYRPGPYRNFYIWEPTRRKVSAAPFRDRVVHHALCRVIGPLFDRVFVPDSYACRTGRGTHRALDRCREFVRRFPYGLKADVLKFFPSVDHRILLELLARRIRCRPTLALIRLILDGGAGVLADEYPTQWFPGDDLLTPLDRPRGLPIGNLTSQFWADVYMHELDRFVGRELRWPAYLRYVDDFLLFGDTKPALHEARRRIGDFLPSLRLSLHPVKTRVFPAGAGVPFLGFVLSPHRTRLKRDGVKRFVRRMRRLGRAYAVGGVPVSRLSASVRSWAAHAAYGQTYRLREALFARFTFSRGA